MRGARRAATRGATRRAAPSRVPGPRRCRCRAYNGDPALTRGCRSGGPRRSAVMTNTAETDESWQPPRPAGDSQPPLFSTMAAMRAMGRLKPGPVLEAPPGEADPGGGAALLVLAWPFRPAVRCRIGPRRTAHMVPVSRRLARRGRLGAMRRRGGSAPAAPRAVRARGCCNGTGLTLRRQAERSRTRPCRACGGGPGTGGDLPSGSTAVHAAGVDQEPQRAPSPANSVAAASPSSVASAWSSFFDTSVPGNVT